VVGVLAAALAAGYFFWARDSSLVAVTDVEVAGVTAGDRERIVAELTEAAEGMTTLHVERQRIERVAAAFPTIESVSVDANFPHGMRIEVAERPPRLLVRGGGREVPVAADGTLLEGVSVAEDELPVLEVDDAPGSGALGGEPLEQALIVGATPEPLRPLIEKIAYTDDYGVEITLRGEIPVRFGSGTAAHEKWAAAAAVLADPKLDALTYVDVRVPERPAAGGAAKPLQSVDPPV
jgi:cell division protein FtsQ